jgi:hypothetical protein
MGETYGAPARFEVGITGADDSPLPGAAAIIGAMAVPTRTSSVLPRHPWAQAG